MNSLKMKLSIVIVAILASLVLSTLVAAAESGVTLKQVNNEIRAAQRDMFSGKKEKAMASLENIKKHLTLIKADDPNNPGLALTENKFKKLVKDLERRTGKNLGGGTLTAAATSSETKMAPKPLAKKVAAHKSETAHTLSRGATSAGGKLPYAARKPYSTAARLVNSTESTISKLNDPAYSGDKEQLVGDMQKKISQAKQSLAKAKKLAAAQGVASHPDFDALELKIANAEKSMAAAQSGYAENKAAAQASAGQVDADVAELKTALDQVQPLFDKATGYVFSYNDLKALEDVIAQIENFEKNDLDAIKTKMQTFAAKYGTTKNEIDAKADGMGYAGTYYKASYPYTALAEGIKNVSKTRTVMAEDLVRRINTTLGGISNGPDFNIVERYNNVKNWLKMAVRYHADNPKVRELQGSIDQRISAGMKAFHARVDARTWPHHASNAPGNANALAKSALNWFKNSPDWGKRSSKVRHPLAVVVTGPWSVQKTNLLGEPIMYGLPIKLAVMVDEDKELNVARVYELTMRTAESRGVKKAPPFTQITVGNSYFIRPDKVR